MNKPDDFTTRFLGADIELMPSPLLALKPFYISGPFDIGRAFLASGQNNFRRLAQCHQIFQQRTPGGIALPDRNHDAEIIKGVHASTAGGAGFKRQSGIRRRAIE